jgi:hypothetical protein
MVQKEGKEAAQGIGRMVFFESCQRSQLAWVHVPVFLGIFLFICRRLTHDNLILAAVYVNGLVQM